MASGDTKTEAMLNVLGNGGSGDEFRGCCNTKTQQYILDAIDRVQNVEDEVEELKNNPDVVDIVDTYADLQAYDKSTLTDKDIIRVLEDSTHNNKSTYYRYSASTDSFTYVGEAGGGGVEYVDLTITGATQTGFTVSAEKTKGEVIDLAKDDKNVIFRVNVPSGYSQILHGYYELPLFNYTDGGVDDNVVAMTLLKLVNDFYDVVFGYDVGAGTVSTGTISILVTPAAPNVVQTTGTSTTDVMSQNAVTSMVFADPSDSTDNIRIGNPNPTGMFGVNIGGSASQSITTQRATNIGGGSGVIATGGTAIGNNAYVNNTSYVGSVALGAYSRPTSAGQVHIGTTQTQYGYNSTNYRLLSGVHDPVDAHDAATKGYVDANAGGFKTLTSADYNWPVSDPQGIAYWLLDDGVYYTASGVRFYYGSVSSQWNAAERVFIVETDVSPYKTATSLEPHQIIYYRNNKNDGSNSSGYPYTVLTTNSVVQTTGDSTANVMSQNAVTSMIFSNPATATNISIGNSNAGTDALSIGVSAYGAGNYSIALGDHSNTYSGSEAIAIGHSARARKTGAIAIGYNTNDGEEGHIGSIALGATAKTDGVGQLNIGTTSTDYGYNGNSNYRIIRGVYDGQLSHDAVTVGQVNSVIDAINTALSTNIPHIGA